MTSVDERGGGGRLAAEGADALGIWKYLCQNIVRYIVRYIAAMGWKHREHNDESDTRQAYTRPYSHMPIIRETACQALITVKRRRCCFRKTLP